MGVLCRITINIQKGGSEKDFYGGGGREGARQLETIIRGMAEAKPLLKTADEVGNKLLWKGGERRTGKN